MSCVTNTGWTSSSRRPKKLKADFLGRTSGESVQMDDSQTAYRQKIFNDLVASLKNHGAGQIELSNEGPEGFTAKTLLTPVASCVVNLLKDEPTFIVRFDSGVRPITGITFNVSNQDAALTSIAAGRSFPDTDAAAQWLIDFLSSAVS